MPTQEKLAIRIDDLQLLLAAVAVSVPVDVRKPKREEHELELFGSRRHSKEFRTLAFNGREELHKASAKQRRNSTHSDTYREHCPFVPSERTQHRVNCRTCAMSTDEITTADRENHNDQAIDDDRVSIIRCGPIGRRNSESRYNRSGGELPSHKGETRLTRCPLV